MDADYNLDTSAEAVQKAVHTTTLIFLTRFKCFWGQVVDLLIIVWYNKYAWGLGVGHLKSVSKAEVIYAS